MLRRLAGLVGIPWSIVPYSCFMLWPLKNTRSLVPYALSSTSLPPVLLQGVGCWGQQALKPWNQRVNSFRLTRDCSNLLPKQSVFGCFMILAKENSDEKSSGVLDFPSRCFGEATWSLTSRQRPLGLCLCVLHSPFSRYISFLSSLGPQNFLDSVWKS